MKILVVEDDQHSAAFLSRGLKEAGYIVETADDGITGLDKSSDGSYDALIVDRMLPRLDGLIMVETLRRAGHVMPVLFLSALGEVDERIRGLRAGGDDYVAKPFHLEEVLARLEALLRRRQHAVADDNILRAGDLEIDRGSREVRRAGVAILLQPREYHLLEYLMIHAGQVVTRMMLLEAVWDYDFDPQTNVIDVHISRLRQKLGDTANPIIHTVRGAGYMLRAKE